MRTYYECIQDDPKYDPDYDTPTVMPGCSDRMCGAEDCGTCFPYAEYVYEDDIEDEDDIVEDVEE